MSASDAVPETRMSIRSTCIFATVRLHPRVTRSTERVSKVSANLVGLDQTARRKIRLKLANRSPRIKSEKVAHFTHYNVYVFKLSQSLISVLTACTSAVSSYLNFRTFMRYSFCLTYLVNNFSQH